MRIEYVEVKIIPPEVTVVVGLIPTQLDKRTWTGGRSIRLQTSGECDHVHVQATIADAFNRLEQETRFKDTHG